MRIHHLIELAERIRDYREKCIRTSRLDESEQKEIERELSKLKDDAIGAVIDLALDTRITIKKSPPASYLLLGNRWHIHVFADRHHLRENDVNGSISRRMYKVVDNKRVPLDFDKRVDDINKCPQASLEQIQLHDYLKALKNVESNNIQFIQTDVAKWLVQIRPEIVLSPGPMPQASKKTESSQPVSAFEITQPTAEDFNMPETTPNEEPVSQAEVNRIHNYLRLRNHHKQHKPHHRHSNTVKKSQSEEIAKPISASPQPVEKPAAPAQTTHDSSIKCDCSQMLYSAFRFFKSYLDASSDNHSEPARKFQRD